MSNGMKRWVDSLRGRGRAESLAAGSMHEAVKGLRRLVAQGEALPRAAESLEKTGEQVSQLGDTLGSALDRSGNDLVNVVRDAMQALRTDMKTVVEDAGAMTRQTVEPMLQAGLERTVGVAAERVEALAATLERHAAERAAADAALVERLEERTEALFERLVASQTERAASLETSVRERTDALLGRLDASAAALSEVANAQQAALAVAVESAEARVARLEAESGQRLTQVIELARESASVLRACGAELSAVAESFGASVDRHREGADAWLESLGSVEGAVDSAGRGAAAEALAAQLSATEEVLARQLEFQRELFEQLQALRGGGEEATRPSEGVDEDGEAADE